MISLSVFAAEKDWDDIKFGVDNKVDFYAVSFVKDAQVVHELKSYLQSNLDFSILTLINLYCLGNMITILSITKFFTLMF